MNAPGKGILKVVSILYIVFGGLWVLLAIIGFAATSLLAELGPLAALGALGAAAAGIIVGIIFLIAAAVNLVVGIIGVKDPTKSTFFIVFGFILGAFALINMFSAFNFWSILGLAMPVLLIVGGFMNKNAAVPAEAPPTDNTY